MSTARFTAALVTTDPAAITAAVLQWCADRHAPLYELARRAPMSLRTLAKLRTTPCAVRFETVRKLARVLAVPPESLLGGDR